MIPENLQCLYVDFLRHGMKIAFKKDGSNGIILMWTQGDEYWDVVGADIYGGDDIILKYQSVSKK
ncbi:MAG: hypothetical protein WC523_04945 [Patescibacteria group bacterium]